MGFYVRSSPLFAVIRLLVAFFLLGALNQEGIFIIMPMDAAHTTQTEQGRVRVKNP